jgi:hypothetical protein
MLPATSLTPIVLSLTGVVRDRSRSCSDKRAGDFINRPPMVYHLLRNRILFKSDLGLR